MEKIIDQIPKNITRCSDTVDLIQGAIVNNSFNIIYNEHWKSIHYINDRFLTEKIMDLLNKHKFLVLNLDIFYNNVESPVEHRFILCKMNEVIYKIDSYINVRPISKNVIFVNDIIEFFDYPTIGKWNNMFSCYENVERDRCTDIFVEIEYNTILTI